MTHEHALSDAERRVLLQAHEILQRGYTCEFLHEHDGSWSARVVELGGCSAIGETREEAEEMLGDSALYWIILTLECGEVIPEPIAAAEAPFVYTGVAPTHAAQRPSSHPSGHVNATSPSFRPS